MRLGSDGVNGENPPQITDIGELQRLGFGNQGSPVESREGTSYTEQYYVYGKQGNRATDGGNGGCGAPGGYTGKSLIIGFQNTTPFDVIQGEGIAFIFITY